eukprot:8512190-Pyramimonas_sp.AAC.1
MQGWVDKMKGDFGADCEGWPDYGRKSKFLPLQSGPSMAVEFNVGNGWEALAAERLPQQLDDDVKECHCKFYDAAQKMSPEELAELIPCPPR